MSKKFLFSFLLIFSMFLVGCTTDSNQPESQPSQLEQKQGDTEVTGKIGGSEGSYFIQVSGLAPTMIDSYAVDLSQYVGQTLTVVGQYSGDTLFVGEVR